MLLVAPLALAQSRTGPKSPDCPSLNIDDVLKDKTVQEALDEAWKKSLEGTPQEREAGAWVYQCRELPPAGKAGKTQYYTLVTPIVTGSRDTLDLANLSRFSGCRIVATIHTHPGPATGGTFDNSLASPHDIHDAAVSGVPGIVRYGTGNNTTDFTYGFRKTDNPVSPYKQIVVTDEFGNEKIINAVPSKENPKPQWRCPAANPGTPALQLNASCENPDDDSFVVTNNTGARQSYEVASSVPERITVLNQIFELDPGESTDVTVQATCACQCTPSTTTATIAVTGGLEMEVPATLGCGAIPDCGGSGGDPHLWTDTGFRFDFQGAGEYVLAKSTERPFEVQVRSEPWQDSTTVSINTAAAVNIDGDRIGFYAGRASPVSINGRPTALAADTAILLPGGAVLRAGLGRFTINCPHGDVVEIIGVRTWMNVHVHVAGPASGMVIGDGDRLASTLRTRDGRAIAPPLTKSALYGKFGASWLVTATESLFDYAPGKSTTDYRIPEFPSRMTSVADLDAEAVTAARQICTEYGVTSGYAMDMCVFDLAATGDESFAILASSGIGGADRTFTEVPVAPNDAARLASPATARIESDFEVSWSGPVTRGDFIAIARSSLPPLTFDRRVMVSSPGSATLRAPNIPGDYEIRYVSATDGVVAEKRVISITTTDASVDAVDAIDAGAPLSVTWSGPAEPRDYLAVARIDQTASEYDNFVYARLGESKAILRAPDTPGEYEIRYVAAANGIVLAQRRIRVEAVEASLTTPTSAAAGSPIEVSWTGPGNNRDYLAVARPDTPPGQYDNYAYVRAGDAATMLRAPEDPGVYEVRYVTGYDRVVLDRVSINVTPVSAMLRAPSTANAGRELVIDWTGPANARDFISIASPGSSAESYLAFVYARTPGAETLVAPTTPGDYEIRYVTGYSNTILARSALRVESSP
jgi:hypothetical protein